jgi:hypothetical protein
MAVMLLLLMFDGGIALALIVKSGAHLFAKAACKDTQEAIRKPGHSSIRQTI